MNPDRLARIEELFLAARERPEREWDGYLREVCSDDDDLRGEVLTMLRAQERAFSWFDGLESELARLTPEEPEIQPSLEGKEVGRYRIVRELGRGGMGIVYLAERLDFAQQAALKVIRGGRESDETLRRFLAERQILSRLQHPGIARLIDGGSTPEGMPYFVLEYVDGVPLMEHAKTLSVDARLELFLEVGDAVEYAHRNLVVHRDLKPANILVTGEGHPKLLDFGIAKLLEVEEGATLTGVRPLTPEFAAPEQLKGEPVTTITDVYGLGMVLFELLSGKRPFAFRDRSWTELERIILHEEAPLVSRSGGKGLEGDLDRICAKALEKEPARRYQSVHELLADVRRHQQGLPIAARGNNRLYRARKFVERNRVAVALGAAALLLTVGFTATLALQSVRLAKERDKAQQVAELFVDLFSVADPDAAHGERITAREILDRGVGKVRHGLTGQDEVKSALLDVVGRVYHKLGLYDRAVPLMTDSLALRRKTGEGDVAEGLQRLGQLRLDQGRYADAAKLLRESLDLRRRTLGARHRDTARSATFLALALLRQGDAQAEPLFREAVATHRSLRPSSPLDLADSLTGLALYQNSKGAYSEAETLLREGLVLQRQALGNDHRLVAETLNNLGSTLSRLGRDKDSEPLQREALGILRRIYPDGHPKLATAANNLGLMLMASGNEAEAEGLFREALAIRRAKLPDGHPDLAQTLGNLGLLLQNRGALTEAEPLHLEALAIRRKAFGAGHLAVVVSLGNLGQLEQARKNFAEAESLLREAADMARKTAGAKHPLTANCIQNLALLLAERNRAEAETLYREALALRRQILPAGHPHFAYTLLGLGEWLTDHGAAAQAEPILREAVEIRRKTLPPTHPLMAEAESALGACLNALGRRADAELLLVRSDQSFRSRPGPPTPAATRAAVRLASFRRQPAK
jgi:tetratricopeptide (TPR) repeat protein